MFNLTRSFTAIITAALVATTPAQAGGRHNSDAAVAFLTGFAVGLATSASAKMDKKRHRGHFRGRGRPHFGHHRPRRFRGGMMPRGERFARPRRHPIYGDSRPFGERDRQMWYGRR